MTQRVIPAIKRRGRIESLFHELKTNWLLFLMLLPGVVYFFIFAYLPMTGVIMAFENYSYRGGMFGSPFVGLQNFRFLFSSGAAWRITRNTLLYNIVFISVDIVFQVSFAVMLSEMTSRVFKKTAQSLMFLPYFVSYVLLAAFIYNIFNYNYGTLNAVLTTAGMEKFDAYSSPGIWPFVLVFFNTWKGLGYGIVVYMAAITGIHGEYYESARIDGATKWQEIIHITLPMLRSTISVITLFAIGKIMRGQFELFYQIIGNNGTLYPTTDIIDTYVFRSLTQNFNVSMGTAAGLYQSLTSFILVLITNTIVTRVDPECALF